VGETLGQLPGSRKLYPMFKKDTVMTFRNLTFIATALAIVGGIATADIAQITEMAPRAELSKAQRMGLVVGASNAELTPKAQKRLLKKSLRECSQVKCTNLDLRHLPITDLAVLSDMTHLRTLYLSYTDVADLRPIAGLTQVQHLHLGHTKISDLAPIKAFSNLTLLHIWGTEITDFTPISNFTDLTELALSDTKIKSLSILRPLKKLRNLALENVEVHDIRVLEGLPNLQTVETLHTDHFNQRTLKRLEKRGVFFGSIMVMC
jgi:hypothetical protein